MRVVRDHRQSAGSAARRRPIGSVEPMTAAEPRPALVPDQLRRPLLGVTAAAALVFAVLAARYAGDGSSGRIDAGMERIVDRLPVAIRWAMALGSPPVVLGIAVITAVGCLKLGHRRLAVLAIVGPGLTGVATTLLKPVIGRTLSDAFAYPSGHTGGATAIGLVVAFVLVAVLRPRRGTGLAVLATSSLLVGGAVGAATVFTGAHYPTDAVGGFCTAVVIVLVSALLLDRYLPTRASGPRRPRRARDPRIR